MCGRRIHLELPYSFCYVSFLSTSSLWLMKKPPEILGSRREGGQVDRRHSMPATLVAVAPNREWTNDQKTVQASDLGIPPRRSPQWIDKCKPVCRDLNSCWDRQTRIGRKSSSRFHFLQKQQAQLLLRDPEGKALIVDVLSDIGFTKPRIKIFGGIGPHSSLIMSASEPTPKV